MGWSLQTFADSFTVKAKVPAPPLTEPATITSPSEGTHISDSPVLIRGTCPTDSYVNIYDNDLFDGTVICAADKTFELHVSLFPGANKLESQDFNFTDDAGPSPAPVDVFYDAPVPLVASETPPNPDAEPPEPFLIKTEFKYQAYIVGQSGDWSINVSGGVPPYAINVDWGDGSNSLMSKKTEGVVNLHHRYKTTGSNKKNNYIIKIHGSDSEDHNFYIQLFAIVNSSALAGTVASIFPPTPPISRNWLLAAWPAYGAVSLMYFSFWLGEKEELIRLRRKGVLRRKKPKFFSLN